MLISVQTSPPSGGLTRPFPKRKKLFCCERRQIEFSSKLIFVDKVSLLTAKKKVLRKFSGKKIPLVTFREYSVSKIYGTKKKDPSLESVLKILVTKILAHSKQHFLFRCQNTLNLQTNTKKAPILQRSGLVCFEDPLFS